MSREKLQQEADRWYRQSIDDLDAAQGEAQTALAAAQRLLHQVEQWLRA